MTAMQRIISKDAPSLTRRLGQRSIVFVGLMGAGKSVIGRQVAQSLGLDFIDSDHEIETVSRMTVPEIFAAYGEAEFRSLERRVIARLLKDGPRVVSTGGGAFIDQTTRVAVAQSGISVWLKADLATLMERVKRRQNRPLLDNPDPRAVMQRLMDERYPVYATADIAVLTGDQRKEIVVDRVVAKLASYLGDAEEKDRASS